MTILVPTFNSVQTVQATLSGILEQKFEGSVELVVVDDGSTDTTTEVCEALGIRVQRNERNVGLTASLNRAIQTSRGDIIVLLHPDAIPLSDHWLSDLVEPLHQKEIAATCSLQHAPNLNRVNITLWEKFLWGKISPHHAFNCKADAYKKMALEQIGSFDQTTFRTAGDDEDLSLRFRMHGWKLKATSAEIRHDHRFGDGPSWEILTSILRKEYTYGRAGGALRRKFPGHKLGAYVYPTPKSAFNDGFFRAAICLGSIVPFTQLICIPMLAIASVTGVRTVARRTRPGISLIWYPFFNILRYWCYAFGYVHGFASRRQQ